MHDLSSWRAETAAIPKFVQYLYIPASQVSGSSHAPNLSMISILAPGSFPM
jgi:hypothetical protein